MIGISKSHNSQMKASDNSVLINPRKIYLSSFQTPVHAVSNFRKPFLTALALAAFGKISSKLESLFIGAAKFF